MSDNIFGLACKQCGFVFDPNSTVGVMAAHSQTEHDLGAPQCDLVVLCPRCQQPMAHFATIGQEIHFHCEPCHRGRVIHQRNMP